MARLSGGEDGMRVLVMGAGGLGAFFGGALALRGHEVVFVARGAQLAALRERGLTIRWCGKETRLERVTAVESPVASGGAADLVLLAVKTYDVADATAALRPVIGPETAVLTLQNGVETPDQVAALLGSAHVLAGTAVIFSAVVEPGVVETGEIAGITLGELDGSASERVERIAAAFREAGVEATISADARRALWEKLLVLAPNATITSAAGLPVGAVRDTAEGAALYRQLVAETAAAGRAAGVGLPPDAEERALALLMNVPPGATTSMQRDFAAGRRVELEEITGAVVRHGRECGVAVPGFAALYAVLKARAAHAAAGRARVEASA